MSGDREILKVFEQNLDPYISFAQFLYKQRYDVLFAEYERGDKGKRTVAKPGVLGCGYMLSKGRQYENKQTGEIEATGLLGYAQGMGINLTPEQAALSVDTWRATYKQAVNFWYDLERAAMRTARSGQRTECGPLGFDIEGAFLRMRLPSERFLHYYRPRVLDQMKPWGKVKPTLTYEGFDHKRQWGRIDTHPGKLTENGDQAIARDLLANGMVKAAAEGLPIVVHVHDQIVGMVPEDEADYWCKLLLDCLCDLPPWAGNMPVSASGHISKWFVKD